MNRKLIFFLVILVSLCAISHASAAEDEDIVTIDEADTAQELDLTVDESADDKLNEGYLDIQNKIDNANDGDNITLTGEYEWNVVVNVSKSVNIVGTGDGATVKWTGEGKNYSSSFFNVEAPNVTLKNIKFLGGTFTFAGAIVCAGDNCTIDNCEFRDNMAVSTGVGIGGAIMVVGKNCTIKNSNFTNNRAYQHGGAILIAGDNTQINNCEFNENIAIGDEGHGGAIMVFANNCLIENSTFTNNYCTAYGGAIDVANRTNVIRNCKFYRNYVTGEYEDNHYCGGGAINSFSTGLLVDECTFEGNEAEKALGGAINVGINNTIKNSFFKNNTALAGNSIFASESSNITSNVIVLAYQESIEESIYGIDEDVLNASNTFVPTKIDSVVKFNAGMVFEYTRSGTISVIVDGGVLEEKNIKVLDHPEAKISFSGTTLIVSGLAVGKYTLRVTTTPDANHNAVDADLSITVNKATAVIKASKATVALKKGTLWTIKLVDSKTGNPIANMKLTLKVYTGSKYKTVSVNTNAKGEATYQTKGLAKGTHKVVVSGSHAGYNFNTLTSSIKVIKQTPLKITVKKKIAKDGSTLSITVKNKNKPINGIKIKVMVYTGKKLTKTINLKSKTKEKHKGVCGWGTNKLTTGNHKVVIMPADIKYGGSKTLTMNIKSSAKKYPKWETIV